MKIKPTIRSRYKIEYRKPFYVVTIHGQAYPSCPQFTANCQARTFIEELLAAEKQIEGEKI